MRLLQTLMSLSPGRGGPWDTDPRAQQLSHVLGPRVGMFLGTGPMSSSWGSETSESETSENVGAGVEEGKWGQVLGAALEGK